LHIGIKEAVSIKHPNLEMFNVPVCLLPVTSEHLQHLFACSVALDALTLAI